MKKKSSRWIILASVMLMAATPLQASAATMQVSADQRRIRKGTDITLTMTLDEQLNQIVCMDYRVYYDTEKFAFKEGSAQGHLKISKVPVIYGSEGDPCCSMYFADEKSGGQTIESGQICQLTFTALEDYSGDWTEVFSVERAHLAKTDLWDSFQETDDAKVECIAAPAVLIGDVNGDGKVTLKDVFMIYAYAGGISGLTEEQAEAGDVNQDGRTDSTDAKLIYSYIKGTISSFPKAEES